MYSQGGHMLRLKNFFLSFLIIFFFSFLLHQPLGHNIIFAQEGTFPSGIIESPQAQKLIQSGQVSPQQIQEGLNAAESGQISPDVIKQYQKKIEQGSLTPAEIEAGKKTQYNRFRPTRWVDFSKKKQSHPPHPELAFLSHDSWTSPLSFPFS